MLLAIIFAPVITFFVSLVGVGIWAEHHKHRYEH